MLESRPTSSSPPPHDLRSSRATWVNSRDLANHIHHSTAERFHRFYRRQLIALSTEHPMLIQRDPERGWQIEPTLANTVFGITLPPPVISSPENPPPPQPEPVLHLLDFHGDPAVVYHARRIREVYWIQAVREWADAATHGVSAEQIAHHRRELTLLFNQHPDPQWWLARDPT